MSLRRVRNSGLAGIRFHRPDDIVRWHGAMQAQDYGPAKWSVGQRSANLLDLDLDRAVADGSIVRTHVLRPTWHFVARDDLRWLLALTGPRVQQHNAGRYRELGLDPRTRARAEAVVASALRGGNHLTRKRIAEVLEERGIDCSGQRLPHILMHCELEALICSGGGGGREHTYALVEKRVPAARPQDRNQAVVELVRRYLASHGPATVKDLSWWSSLTVADITQALSSLGAKVEAHSLDGIVLWSTPSDPLPRGGPTIHLLQGYDELIVGYTESRFFGDPRSAAARAAWTDRSLPAGVVLRGGNVAGHWRRTARKDAIRVEAVMYDEPEPPIVRAVEAAAKRLRRFTGRPVHVEVTRR